MEVGNLGGSSSAGGPGGEDRGLQQARTVLGGLQGQLLQQLAVQDEVEHVVDGDLTGFYFGLVLTIRALSKDYFRW